MQWFLSDDQSKWEYRDGPAVIATLQWKKFVGSYGAYVDDSGDMVERNFVAARKQIERREDRKGAKK
jgi:hypothetical protein